MIVAVYGITVERYNDNTGSGRWWMLEVDFKSISEGRKAGKQLAGSLENSVYKMLGTACIKSGLQLMVQSRK